MTPNRDMFWQIEYVWIFYALACLATVLFLAGVGTYLQVWKKNAGNLAISFSKDSFKTVVLDTILGRRLLHGHVAAGIMHLLLFWGFLILFMGTALLFVHDYLFSFLTGTAYLVFSMTMEMGGLMFIAGILWALIRRYIQRVSRLERRLEDALVPAWLLLIGLSGFMVEGFRLASQQPAWASWSFVGGWIGMMVSPGGAKSLYPYLWWGHALMSLGLIAMIPYTKLFHILAAPAAIYSQRAGKPVVLDMDEDIDGDMDEDIGGFSKFDLGDSIFFDACMRCGRCVEACPSAGAGEPFAPREFVQAVRHTIWQDNFRWGDIRILDREETINVDEKLWYCTTCRACLEVCPVYGAPFEAVMKQRILAVEEGTHVPPLMNQTLEKIFKYDNPWESSKRNRGAWADGMDVVNLSKRGAEADLCYFVGCTTSFDDTAKGIAQSFSKILWSAGVHFGILGKKEPCCGDIARRAGEVGLFVEQTEKCLDLFERYDITDVVTSSPHCFHTFRNEYPEAPFTARHYTLVLRDLIAAGKLRFEKGAETTVTYHDPCYLGRYNQIYNEPREIIGAIPGMNLVEMTHHRADSLCCGGGGGRMWQDIKAEVKMSDVRIREAEATGAQILVTACPLCRIMLEDARKAAGLNEKLQVMDLNELVLEALEGNGRQKTLVEVDK
jgi:Fe-S oxidoreductase/nitrate reductase gamma subunit